MPVEIRLKKIRGIVDCVICHKNKTSYVLQAYRDDVKAISDIDICFTCQKKLRKVLKLNKQ